MAATTTLAEIGLPAPPQGGGPWLKHLGWVMGLLLWSITGCGLTPTSQAASGSSRPVALLVAPDDDPANILDAVRAARRRVYVEMYMLTAAEAIAALLDAHSVGAEVRVLLEPSPFGEASANEPAFALLSAAGIDVRWTHRPTGYVHTKMIVVDSRVAYIMTLNLSTAGLRSNREFAAVDRDPADVRRAEEIWNADALGGEPVPASADPRRVLVSAVDARTTLASAIDHARESIMIEMEELSDPDLTAHLIAARGRGVTVLVVAPALNRSVATNLALGRLSAGGVDVRVLPAPTLHAKAMVLDRARSYVGSINFTRASLDDNREVGLLWNDSASAARLISTITSDAGRSP